jgi:hypothetical protein
MHEVHEVAVGKPRPKEHVPSRAWGSAHKSLPAEGGWSVCRLYPLHSMRCAMQ